MKSVFLSLLCLAVMTNCVAPESEHQAQMTFIEETVQLPEDARPIDEYSRNYAWRPDGKIIAIYVVPFEPMGGAPGYDDCVVILENSEEKPCSDGDIAEIRQQDAANAAAFGEAGRSRWFSNHFELPSIFDGGCMQVEIVFDPRSQEIENVKCNGSA